MNERDTFYNDVLVTFTEGGIQMIGEIVEMATADDPDYGFHYVDVTVAYDEEDDETYVVNRKVLSKAFTAMRKGEVKYLSESSRKRMLEAYRECDACDIDAVDATNLVEIGLFGEVVYA